MFDWLKRKMSPPDSAAAGMRDLLFGDIPLEKWAPAQAQKESPWIEFRKAKECIDANDSE